MPLRLFTFFLLLLTIVACTGLKPLAPLDPARKTVVLEGCRRPFLPGKYRLVHELEMVMPDGAKGTAIGVVVADPRTRAFRTVLMTIEGLVLFDAEAGGERLTVHRAIPPFDAPAFAEGLADDIRLAFFLPDGEPTAWGEGEEGTPACRFEHPDGRFVEVTTLKDGGMAIRLYRAGQGFIKKVKIAPLESPGLADTIEIVGGWLPYTLRLRLLESEALDTNAGPTPAAVLPGVGPSGPGGGNEKGERSP